jgi:hypothetical protein
VSDRSCGWRRQLRALDAVEPSRWTTVDADFGKLGHLKLAGMASRFDLGWLRLAAIKDSGRAPAANVHPFGAFLLSVATCSHAQPSGRLPPARCIRTGAWRVTSVPHASHKERGSCDTQSLFAINGLRHDGGCARYRPLRPVNLNVFDTQPRWSAYK